MYIPPIIPKEDVEATYSKYRQRSEADPSIGSRPALIIVDMTRGFVEDRFPTGFSKTGVPCADNILRLLKFFREMALPVIYTRDVTVDGKQYHFFRGAWNNKSKPLTDDLRSEGNKFSKSSNLRKVR